MSEPEPEQPLGQRLKAPTRRAVKAGETMLLVSIRDVSASRERRRRAFLVADDARIDQLLIDLALVHRRRAHSLSDDVSKLFSQAFGCRA